VQLLCKKKKYCPTVWARHTGMAYLRSALSGSITFFSLIDAKINTRIPAKVKRIPANTIWLAVSEESTCRK